MPLPEYFLKILLNNSKYDCSTTNVQIFHHFDFTRGMPGAVVVFL